MSEVSTGSTHERRSNESADGSRPRRRSTHETDVRVRFCPSPTGSPHVGLARTALFNWAFARHHGGTFVFRIEDTDAARDSQESYDTLLEVMRWLGFDWDEGPGVGGPHAPYRQSERGEIYADVLRRLREAGRTYDCYCTNEEVEARRKASGSKLMGYDGFCRELTPEQVAEFAGRDPVARFRMPDGEIAFDDLVRGTITFHTDHVPDFAVSRANGQPLYTLVNPVDDALMEITHVLRGEDLLSSTPRQLALYDALQEIGIAKGTPRFGHLPYVMGQGNKKLSKRDPEASLLGYRTQGFLPEGLLNYLALLGWAIGPDRDVFSIDEMVAAFDIGDVNPNPARFDLKKAEAINADHMRMLSIEDLTHRVIPFLQERGGRQRPAERRRCDAARARHAVGVGADEQAHRGRADAGLPVRRRGGVPSYRRDRRGRPRGRRRVVRRPLGAVGLVDAVDRGRRCARHWSRREGSSRALAFGPVRVAVTGSRVSPPLFESLELLGRERSLARLEAARG